MKTVRHGWKNHSSLFCKIDVQIMNTVIYKSIMLCVKKNTFSPQVNYTSCESHSSANLANKFILLFVVSVWFCVQKENDKSDAKKRCHSPSYSSSDLGFPFPRGIIWQRGIRSIILLSLFDWKIQHFGINWCRRPEDRWKPLTPPCSDHSVSARRSGKMKACVFLSSAFVPAAFFHTWEPITKGCGHYSCCVFFLMRLINVRTSKYFDSTFSLQLTGEGHKHVEYNAVQHKNNTPKLQAQKVINSSDSTSRIRYLYPTAIHVTVYSLVLLLSAMD